jgi:hypothetical protein
LRDQSSSFPQKKDFFQKLSLSPNHFILGSTIYSPTRSSLVSVTNVEGSHDFTQVLPDVTGIDIGAQGDRDTEIVCFNSSPIETPNLNHSLGGRIEEKGEISQDRGASFIPRQIDYNEFMILIVPQKIGRFTDNPHHSLFLHFVDVILRSDFGTFGYNLYRFVSQEEDRLFPERISISRGSSHPQGTIDDFAGGLSSPILNVAIPERIDRVRSAHGGVKIPGEFDP